MALTSPGVEVTIIDESQYIPAATNSVPYILLATAQNKVSGAGVGVAAGTLKANANKTYLISSQRDLIATFGVPFFYKTTAGTPINGYELNEYGLLAAWSALGVSNRCYVQRADIDLSELTATLIRPTGDPADGTYWLDTANTQWGLFEWNITTGAFTAKTPTVLDDTTYLNTGTTQPLDSYGAIGDYVVVTPMVDGNMHNPVYYKRGGPANEQQTNSSYLQNLYNSWVLVGSDDWKTSWATISGTLAPSTLTPGNTFFINDTQITVAASPFNTVNGISDSINNAAIPGVYASHIGNKLQIYGTSAATNDGSTFDSTGIIAINNGVGTPLTSLGIEEGEYIVTNFVAAPNFEAPRWNSSGPTPSPTGSIWQKTNNVNQGANLVVKKYNSTLGVFVAQSCQIFTQAQNGTLQNSLFILDPAGGGKNIPAGTTIARTNTTFSSTETCTLEILERYATGPMICTGTTTPGSTAFTIGDNFQITFTIPGSATVIGTGGSPIIATLTGTSPADFCAAVSAAVGGTGYNYVTASVNSTGNIVFTHSAGGNITVRPRSGGGTPLDTAGITLSTPFCRSAPVVNGFAGIQMSYFVQPGSLFSYTPSTTAPDQDPVDGRLWYYSATNQADIMIQNEGQWLGYQNVTNDVRGFNLSLTNASGPIFSATAPTTQTNDQPLEYGDLWIDTSDLENYPVLSRWESVDGEDQWVLIDNTDQTTSNGILFADARWAPNGTTDPISDPLPTISSLLISNYLDLDAPDPTLYPQGTLLFNTRRSGFNVKSFQVNYFNATDFPDETLPTVKNAWVTQNPTKDNGSPYMGRQAQRIQIVQALKAGIDTSTSAREEQRQFNLLGCPQYPELIPNMIALNNERNNTAFIVGDTPLRLTPDEIVNYASNVDNEGLPTGTGLLAGDQYSGVFYPSCQTTDLSGSPVVQPPSHMMIRTIIRSDEVAYPWLAPAGTRRGVIDNATQIGYVNAATGEFESIGVRQALRDVLYENRINPITFVPGVGITNFGNKTTTSLITAMDRINVARLVAFLRGRLSEIAKQYLFEPNDQITRNEITNAITSLMIDLVAKRGIYDYLVVCDLTNNTPARIDRNELYVDIAIEPVKAVEFIYIPVRIKNTGEIASQSV
jgi:Phage tail sheath C-terminal domain